MKISKSIKSTLVLLITLFFNYKSFCLTSEDNQINIIKFNSSNYLYDENRLMDASQVEYFQKISYELYQKTKFTIAVALVNDIGNSNISLYTQNIIEKWNICDNTNEGVIILLATKQKKRTIEFCNESKKYFTQSISTHLQQKYLIPSLRTEKYGEGILKISSKIAQMVAKKNNVTLNTSEYSNNEDNSITIGSWLLIILVFIFLIYSMLKNSYGIIKKISKKKTEFKIGFFGNGHK